MSSDSSGNTSPPTLHHGELAFGLALSGLVVGTVGLVLIFTANTHVSTSSGVSFSHVSPAGRRTAIRLTARGLEF